MVGIKTSPYLFDIHHSTHCISYANFFKKYNNVIIGRIYIYFVHQALNLDILYKLT